jgi:hypothetical protein
VVSNRGGGRCCLCFTHQAGSQATADVCHALLEEKQSCCDSLPPLHPRHEGGGAHIQGAGIGIGLLPLPLPLCRGGAAQQLHPPRHRRLPPVALPLSLSRSPPSSCPSPSCAHGPPGPSPLRGAPPPRAMAVRAVVVYLPLIQVPDTGDRIR